MKEGKKGKLKRYEKIVMTPVTASQHKRLGEYAKALTVIEGSHTVSMAEVLRFGFGLVERMYGGNLTLLRQEIDQAYEREKREVLSAQSQSPKEND